MNTFKEIWGDEPTDDGGERHNMRKPKTDVLPPVHPSVPAERREMLVKDLMERLRSGTATHQELAVMTRLLKDNGLVLMPYEPLDRARPRVLPGQPDQEMLPAPAMDFPTFEENDDETA